MPLSSVEDRPGVMTTKEPQQEIAEWGASVLRSTSNARPRLLLSVRDVAEARIAFEVGVDLLDVKNPDRGSLGRPDESVVDSILAERDRNSPKTPVSVALGELQEHFHPIAVHLRSEGACSIPEWNGLDFVKLGLAGAAERADWKADWKAIRQYWNQSVVTPLRWVAVAYADAVSASAPPVEQVIETAIADQCAGVLFDTWCKQGPGLFAFVDIAQLAEWCQRIRAAGLFVALAGKLSVNDLSTCFDLPIDIIAMRSAACLAESRTGSVSRERLLQLRSYWN